MKKRKKILLLELLCFGVVLIGSIVIYYSLSFDNSTNNDTSIESSTYVHSKETVEENAISLIELYKKDFAIYVQNKDTNKEIAEDAKVKVNSTADYYNKYIEKNASLWGKDNFPESILPSLPLIK